METTSRYNAPPRGLRRLLLAYRVTLAVIFSYYWLRFRLRLASSAQTALLLRAVHARNARRIHAAIERLGGLFIKVGQLISIMTNMLPEEFRTQLTTLQDHVPPRPYRDIEARFREEWQGRGPREVFAEFSEKPVASASIGQVHRARTRSGDEVAVKVQYPDIEEIVRIDLRALERIFQLLHWIAPAHGLDAVFAEIRAMIMQELDFSLEAKNLQRITENFSRNRPQLPVSCPRLYPELSTARILTTGWVNGVKVNNLPALREMGVEPLALARIIVDAYCRQIFRDGVYHADPHPGNLLVVAAHQQASISSQSIETAGREGLNGACVTFLDFGAVAELSRPMRRGIVEVLQSALTRDTPRLILAMKDMGFIARGADPSIFERVVDFFHDKFQAEVKLDSFSLSELRLSPERALEDLADLRKLDVSLRDLMEHFHVPKEWILLERTLLLLLGLCTELAPELNPMLVIRPYVEEMVLGQDRDWSKFLVETTRDVVTQAAQLPGELRKFLARAQRGQLEVRFRGLEEGARLVYVAGRQLVYTACGVTAFSAWLILEGREQYDRAEWALYATLFFAACLLGSMILHRAPRRRP